MHTRHIYIYIYIYTYVYRYVYICGRACRMGVSSLTRAIKDMLKLDAELEGLARASSAVTQRLHPQVPLK